MERDRLTFDFRVVGLKSTAFRELATFPLYDLQWLHHCPFYLLLDSKWLTLTAEQSTFWWTHRPWKLGPPSSQPAWPCVESHLLMAKTVSCP